MRVDNLEWLEFNEPPQLEDAVSLARVVRRHRENSKAGASSALLQRTALRADDELLVAALPQPVGKQQELMLPAAQFPARVEMCDLHYVAGYRLQGPTDRLKVNCFDFGHILSGVFPASADSLSPSRRFGIYYLPLLFEKGTGPVGWRIDLRVSPTGRAFCPKTVDCQQITDDHGPPGNRDDAPEQAQGHPSFSAACRAASESAPRIAPVSERHA